MANFIEAKEKKKLRWPKVALSEGKYRWLGRGVLVLVPLLAFTLVEYLNYNDPWQDFTPMQIGLNLIWYYLLELIFYFGRGRRVSAAKWALGIAWGLGMTNHYLISFRGRTLFPGDFLTLGTAVNVAGNYDYSLDRMQLISLLILVLALLALSLLPREKRIPFTLRRFLPSAGIAGVVLAVFFGTGFVENQGIEPSMWTTRGNGLALNFSVCLKYMRVEAPEGYAQESLEQLTADTASDGPSVTVTDPDGTTRPVNVIVIMNESFSDLSVLPGVETNQDAMPFLRSLTENTIKGYAYSSVFGGTTANSEYEFLTGNTTAYLPAGTVPYQMYVSDGDPTLVSQMAALGYRTIAAHPYRSSGWNRP